MALRLTERRPMFDYVRSELQRNIVTIEEHQRISSEYRHNVIRLFLTVPEAREVLRMIETYATQDVSCS
jgi:hypothetical protein